MRAHIFPFALALLMTQSACADTTPPCGCPNAPKEQLSANTHHVQETPVMTLHAAYEVVDTVAVVSPDMVMPAADAEKHEQRGVTKPQPRVVKAGCCDQGYNTRTLWWLLPIALAAGLAWRFLKFRNPEQPA